MKKTLLTLAAIGAFAVPFGVAVAQDDSGVPAEPVPTTNEPDQVRDRERQQTEQRECDCNGAGAQSQQRRQLHEEGCNGPMDREREQNQLEEGTGDGPQVHRRGQKRLEENTEPDLPTDAPARSTGARLQFRHGDGPGRGNR